MYKFKIRRLLKQKLGIDYIENISSGKFSDVALLKLPSGERKVGKFVWGGQIKQLQTDVWPLLDHENIVQLEKTILMPDIGSCCYVMTPQYMTLERIIQSKEFKNDAFNVFKLKRWLSDAVSGTAYLHRNKICHLNISPSSIMISYDSRAKLGGLKYVTSSTEPIRECGIKYPYHPPELCHSRKRNVLVDPVGVDLWSLGILPLQLFTKNKLGVELGINVKIWSEEVYKEIFKEIKELEWNIEKAFPDMMIRPLDVKRLKNFIRMFLSLKPGDRPAAELARKHRFFPSGLFMPKVDPAWKKKASRVNIEMIIEEHNTLENVRKRFEGRNTPGSMNPPIKPHARHQLIKLTESSKKYQREQVRFVKSEECFRTDTSKERKNLQEKTLVLHSEANISAWDRVERPVVKDHMRHIEIDNLKESRGEGSQRKSEEFNQEEPDTTRKKKKDGLFGRAKTWFQKKLRSFRNS